MEHTNTIHIVLQGKGGVGKTFVSWVLAQYIAAKQDIVAINLDAVNQTFAHYSAFNALTIPVAGVTGTDDDDEESIDGSALDDLVAMLLENEKPVVMDTGATSFVPFTEYLHNGRVLDMLEAAGKRVILHSPVMAGDSLDDCLVGSSMVLSQLATETRRAVLWANRHNGPIGTRERPFTDFKLVTDNRTKLIGVMTLPKRDALTEQGLLAVTSAHQTLAQCIDNPDWHVMTRQRMALMRHELFDKLDAIFAGM